MPKATDLSKIIVTMFRPRRGKSQGLPRSNFSQGTLTLRTREGAPLKAIFDFALNGEEGYLCLRFYDPDKPAEEVDTTIHLVPRYTNYGHKVWYFKCQSCTRMCKFLFFYETRFLCHKHFATKAYFKTKKPITIEGIQKDISARSMTKRIYALRRYLELRKRLKRGRI